jgi:integrase
MRTKGTGSVVQLRYRDPKTRKIVKSRYWYILYYSGQRQVRESSGSESRMEAEALLQRRLGETGLGIRPAQDVKSLRYENIRDALVAEYQNQKRGSLWTRTDGSLGITGLKHLDKYFKGYPVLRITTDSLRAYIAARRTQGAKDATIRRNLVLLRSMLNMARKEGKLRLQDVPHFPMPQDSEPVGRYLPPEIFAQLRDQLPKALHPFFTFMYFTGCRLGATRAITWDMVNADATEIKIPAELMKARAPLLIVLAGPGLTEVATMLRKMFRQSGERIFDATNYRAEWQKACTKVKVGKRNEKRQYSGLRIHDLRCSAAINLVDAGVPEDTVMKIGGWKTKAMFSRYNVMDSRRLRAAMELGGEFVAERIRKAERK